MVSFLHSGRNAFMQYPQRDIDRIIASLDAMRDQSDIADRFLKEQEQEFKAMRRAYSMSLLSATALAENREAPDMEDKDGQKLNVPHAFLLSKAKQLEAVLKAAESDLQARKARIRAKKYGQQAFDLWSARWLAIQLYYISFFLTKSNTLCSVCQGLSLFTFCFLHILVSILKACWLIIPAALLP